MAPPPANLIFRKVAKNYVRSIMNYELKDTPILAAKLRQAEEIFGEDSDQSKILAAQLENAKSLENYYVGHIYKQGLHKIVTRLIAAPMRKKEVKHGRPTFFIDYTKFDVKGTR